jgi:hypothetical protein
MLNAKIQMNQAMTNHINSKSQYRTLHKLRVRPEFTEGRNPKQILNSNSPNSKLLVWDIGIFPQ